MIPLNFRTPITLTIDECSLYEHQTFVDEDEFTNWISAMKFAKITNGILYTQVDGIKDRVYAKGTHKINRTGVYMVIYDFNPSRRL